jgi:hypothetical protein
MKILLSILLSIPLCAQVTQQIVGIQAAASGGTPAAMSLVGSPWIVYNSGLGATNWTAPAHSVTAGHLIVGITGCCPTASNTITSVCDGTGTYGCTGGDSFTCASVTSAGVISSAACGATGGKAVSNAASGTESWSFFAFCAVASATGSITVHFRMSASQSSVASGLYEFAGNSSCSSALEKLSIIHNPIAQDTTDGVATKNLVPTQNGEAIIAAMGFDNSDSSITISGGTPFTVDYNAADGSGINFEHYIETAASETTVGSWGITTDIPAIGGFAVSLKPSSPPSETACTSQGYFDGSGLSSGSSVTIQGLQSAMFGAPGGVWAISGTGVTVQTAAHINSFNSLPLQCWPNSTQYVEDTVGIQIAYSSTASTIAYTFPSWYSATSFTIGVLLSSSIPASPGFGPDDTFTVRDDSDINAVTFRLKTDGASNIQSEFENYNSIGLDTTTLTGQFPVCVAIQYNKASPHEVAIYNSSGTALLSPTSVPGTGSVAPTVFQFGNMLGISSTGTTYIGKIRFFPITQPSSFDFAHVCP